MKLKKENLIFRFATEEDAEKILKIYEPYVEKTTITFEYEVPSAEEFKGRIREILKEYPYIICEYENEIIGYVGFGAGLPISGMRNFRFIQMEIMQEMELGKNCIKF